jgi:glycosyltransferase involved in cell wall biosynthesis
MKILMIAPQPFYAERGTPMNVKLMCQVLGSAGYQIDLLVFPTGTDIAIENVNIIRLPNLLRANAIPVGPSFIKLAYDIELILVSLCLLLTKKYDMIHGIEEGGFLSVFWGRLFNISSIFDLDSSISEQLKYSKFIKNKSILNLVKRIEIWCFKNSSLVITVCQALSQRVINQYSRANIRQIEDIPLNREKAPDKNLTEALIRQYGLENSLRIVYTGNLAAYQGIDLLIEAYSALLSMDHEGHSCKLIIIGGSEEQIKHYQHNAKAAKIDNSICWVGQRPADEMGAWMELCHALVSPRSEGENTPLKIYTYMSSGKPLVATRRLTHLQVLDDSVAFLADPEPEAFGAAMYAALHDRGSAADKAERAKRLVEKDYSFEVFRKKLLEAYSFVDRSMAAVH